MEGGVQPPTPVSLLGRSGTLYDALLNRLVRALEVQEQILRN